MLTESTWFRIFLKKINEYNSVYKMNTYLLKVEINFHIKYIYFVDSYVFRRCKFNLKTLFYMNSRVNLIVVRS